MIKTQEVPLAEGFCNSLFPNTKPVVKDRYSKFSAVKVFGKPDELKRVECLQKGDDGICELRRGKFFLERCLWEDPMNSLKHLVREVPKEKNTSLVVARQRSLIKKLFSSVRFLKRH